MDFSLLEKEIERLPKSMKATLMREDGYLSLVLQEPFQRMRYDGGAFESWVLMLHLRAPRLLIVLDIAPMMPHQYENHRFKRFLYRVFHFNRRGFEWFSLGAELENRVQIFGTQFYATDKCFAPPRSDSPGGDKGEKILQHNFSCANSILLALPECENTVIHEDLPINLFWGSKKTDLVSENKIFPSGRRCIDLWSLQADALNIFELKFQDPHIGIVSELFFYSCLCADVFFAPQETRIIIPPMPAHCFRGTEAFYDNDGQLKPIHRINAWFLADRFHSLLDIEYICEMLTTPEIAFQVLRYSYDMPLTFQMQE